MAGSSRLGSWVNVTIAVRLSMLRFSKQSSGQELITLSSGNLSLEAKASLGSIIVTSKSNNFAILLKYCEIWTAPTIIMLRGGLNGLIITSSSL